MKEIIKDINSPILREKCENVNKFGMEIFPVIRDMERVLNEYNWAAGLAANQIGYNKNIILIRPEGKKIEEIINPIIIDKSDEMESAKEQCLSLPLEDEYDVQRYLWVKLEYKNKYGKKRVKKFKGFCAKVVQHELDHINGILIIDKGEKSC